MKKILKAVLGDATPRRLRQFAAPLEMRGRRAIAFLAGKGSRSGNPLIREIRKFGDERCHTFFGYYDVSPFGPRERLLALQTPLLHESPRPDTPARVGYFDLSDNQSRFREIGETSTWCWQQGCRLQWFPEHGQDAVLYNRFSAGRYEAIIRDLRSREILFVYPRPLYAVSPKGDFGISLNFSRLQRLRPGYGYSILADETAGRKLPDDDGLWLVNLKTGASRLLLSTACIASIEPLESMEGAEHYLNHVMFNPDGSRFLFFHLWVREGKRRSRLITCDPDGASPYALINEGHVSHYNWASPNELVAYATHAESGRRYYRYEDRTRMRSVIGSTVLKEDGHPSVSPDGKWILTDTYPDSARDQQLLQYDLLLDRVKELGRFFSPLKYAGELRCDLHPRLDHAGERICVDSTRDGTRSMYVLSLRSGEEVFV